jgi:single-strand DNA-binding protein
MAGVNKVILIGNLGADPEVRHLENGSVVANFNIATSESYTNKSGERVEQTEWHRIELWDRLAQIAEQYLKKGNQVYIEGRLRTENWTDKENQPRSRVSIRANSMTLLGGPNTGSGATNAPQAAERPSPSQQASPINPALAAQDDDDDLPF